MKINKCINTIIRYIYITHDQKKLRSQTSDNMDRWKSRGGRVREEKRRSKKRKSQKKEDAAVRKGSKVTIHCVFPMICASGGSKSRLAKAAGAEPCGQMWDEHFYAVVARSTFPSQFVQNTPCSDHFWKLTCRKSARRCGAKHMWKSNCTKHTRFGPLLEVDMPKKCKPLWREAFPSQNAQSTSVSDRFWKLRCPKSARHCGAKHIWKSTCTKDTMLGPLLEVEMSKKRTPLWCEADFEIKSVNVVLDGRRKGVCTLSKNEQKSAGFVHHSTLHDYNYLLTVASGKWFLQESLPIPNFLKCFQKLLFFQEISSFWFLGNAKNPTDLGLVFDIPKLDYITVQHTTLH